MIEKSDIILILKAFIGLQCFNIFFNTFLCNKWRMILIKKFYFYGLRCISHLHRFHPIYKLENQWIIIYIHIYPSFANSALLN